MRCAILTPLDPAVANSWGTLVDQWPTLIPQGAQGYTSVGIAGLAVYTLTTANNAADQARYMMWNFTGALGAVACTVTIPAIARVGWARNSTTGGKNVILTTGSGTTVTIAPGFTAFWFCDGTNVVAPSVSLGAISGTTGTFTGGLTVGGGATFGSGITATSIGGTTGTFSGGITVSAGGLNVVSGGLNVSAGAVTLSSTVTAGGGITVSAGGLNVVAGGFNVSAGAVTISPVATFASTCTFQGSTSGGSTGAFIYSAGGTLTPTAWASNIGVAVAQSVSAAGFFSVSDRRAKSDIADLTPEAAIEWLRRGRPRTFTMGGVPSSGFIAQEEVERGRHDAISMHDDDRPEYCASDGLVPAGKRLSRNYNFDVAYLTAALQNALERIEALEAAAAGVA